MKCQMRTSGPKKRTAIQIVLCSSHFYSHITTSFGDIQNLARHGTGQLTPSDPARVGGGGLDDL